MNVSRNIQIAIQQIHHALTIKTKLITLAQKFNDYSNFLFYTDDSVKQIGTRQCTSGYSWIQTHPNTPKLTLKDQLVSSHRQQKVKLWEF